MELDTIVCGDCLDVMAETPDGFADLVVADPPYGGSGKTTIKRKGKTIKTSWDWDVFTTTWIPEVYRLTSATGSIIIFSAKEKMGQVIQSCESAGFYRKTCIAWHKTNPVPQFRKKNYLSSWEMLAWLVRDSAKFTFNWKTQKTMHDFIEGSICMGNERLDHPTQKPLYVIERLIEIHSDLADMVFDPFMGSGTTAVAALKLGRRFYGCDINPDYVELANKRIEKTRLEMAQMEMF